MDTANAEWVMWTLQTQISFSSMFPETFEDGVDVLKSFIDF